MQDRWPKQWSHWNRARAVSWTNSTTFTSGTMQWLGLRATVSTTPVPPRAHCQRRRHGATSPPAPNPPQPKRPSPLLEEEFTPQHRSIKAFRELAANVPPALTSHSTAVFDAHEQGEYAKIGRGFRKVLHPVQYVGQMLGNKESTIAFENSLAEKVHANLAHTPPEAHQTPAKGKKTVQQMLGTDYATYDDFWYPHFHTNPPSRSQPPRRTPRPL